MPVSPDIITYYEHLPEQINDQCAALDAMIDGLINADGEVNPPLNFQIDLDFNVDAMKSLDDQILPSRALLMHMTNIERAVYGWRYKASIEDDVNSAEEAAHLKEVIMAALAWFKESFVGRLYAEMDEHHIKASLDEHSQPVVALDTTTEGLETWFSALETLAGDDFEASDEFNYLGEFDDAHVHMQRVNAAHERMAKARQAQWLNGDAAYAFNRLRGHIDKLSDIDEVSKKVLTKGRAGDIEHKELEKYRALYQRFQPYLTTIDESSIVTLSNNKAKNSDVSAKLDSELCYVLGGKDKSGSEFKPNEALSATLSFGLGPLQFFETNDAFPKEQPLKKLLDTEHESLLQLAGDNLWNETHKNMAVITNVFEKVAARSVLDFSGSSLSDYRELHEQNMVKPAAQGNTSHALFDHFKCIERTRCELSFTEQVINNVYQLLSENKQLSSASIAFNKKKEIRNYTRLLQTLFNDANDIVIEPGLTMVDVLTFLQTFIDGESDNALASAGHCVNKLEKCLRYLNGESELVDAFQTLADSAAKLMAKHEYRKRSKLSKADVLEIQGSIDALDNLLAISTEQLPIEGRNHVEQCIASLRAFASGEESSELRHGMDCIDTLETLMNGVKGKQGALVAYSTALQRKLNAQYQGEIQASDLTEGNTQRHLNIEAKKQGFIDSVNDIKQGIQATINALPAKFNEQVTQLQALQSTKGGAGLAMQLNLTGEMAPFSKDVHDFFKAKLIFEQLEKAESLLLTLQKNPNAFSLNEKKQAAYEAVQIARIKMTYLIKEAPVHTLIIEQLQHYGYLLQGNLPYQFSLSPLAQQSLTPIIEEDEATLGGLPKHWRVTLESFTVTLGEQTHGFVDLYDEFQMGITNLNALELPAANLDSKRLAQFWSKNIDKLTTITSAQGMAKADIDALVDSVKKLKLDASKYSALVNVRTFQKKQHFEAYEAFWKNTVPNLLAVSTAFEVKHNLAVGSVSGKIYEQADAFKLTLMKNGAPGITRLQHFDLENSPHFSLRTKQLLEDNLLKQPKENLEALKSEETQLSEFLAALNELSAYSLRGGSAKEEWARWGAFFVGRAARSFLPEKINYVSPVLDFKDSDYLKCKSKVEQLFTQCQPLLAQENPVFTETYLDGLAMAQKNLKALSEGTTKRLSRCQDSIKEKTFSLSLSEQLEAYYDNKSEAYLGNVPVENEMNQTENKRVLLRSIAELLRTNYFLITQEPRGQISYLDADGSSQIEPLKLLESKSFCHKANKAMKEACNLQIDAILADDDSSKKSAKEITQALKKSLTIEYKKELRKKYYHIQLEQMRVSIAQFKEYLNNAQWFEEDATSSKAKRKLLDKLQGIVENKSMSMEARYKNLQRVVTQGSAHKEDIIDNQLSASGYKSLLTADMEPHLMMYSQTLIYLGYMLVKFYRALKGILTGSNDTNERDVLASQLVNTVIPTKEFFDAQAQMEGDKPGDKVNDEFDFDDVVDDTLEADFVHERAEAPALTAARPTFLAGLKRSCDKWSGVPFFFPPEPVPTSQTDDQKAADEAPLKAVKP